MFEHMHAIEDVIQQFSDPLAFLRELVQNSIDAGSGEVEIQIDRDEESGLVTITVCDWGEGMTREIIETKLVRLFSSAKDKDFTKIGKFGIGFVSVFAVEPEVVCVDTGRDGEWWRILFHPDRSYDLIALSNPVEGTTVRLMKTMDEEAYVDLRIRAKVAVRKWCRFTRVPVRMLGEDVREGFDLDGLVVARLEEEGTRAVVAVTTERWGEGAFYNGGLALQWVASDWPYLDFIIDSRYLEHTLTRDKVLEDKHYWEAIERLDELVTTELRQNILEALESWPLDPDRQWDWDRLCGVMTDATASNAKWPPPMSRSAFPTLDRRLVMQTECAKARNRNRLMLSRGRAHFAHLMPSDYVILDVRPGHGAHRLLMAAIKRDVPVLEDVWVHVPPCSPALSGAPQLLAAFEQVLADAGNRPLSVHFGEFAYPFSQLEDELAIAVTDLDTPLHRADLTVFDPFSMTGHVLLNADHPVIADAIAVAVEEPEFAAYTVLKICALHHDAVENAVLTEEIDVRLAMASVERRTSRLERR